MKKETWAWIIGAAVFCVVAGAWVLLFPKTIARIAGGGDNGLTAIVSSLGAVRETTVSDLSKAQKSFEDSLKKMNDSLVADEAQATAIDDLKERLNAMDKEKEKDIPEKSGN